MRKLSLTGIASLISISDEQAMWRVQNEDDHRAFTLLVERWEERICRLCIRMVGNAHSAEDLSQEAFSRLFAKRKDFDPSKRFSTYLWRIALNLCYDELRRMSRRRESTIDEADSAGITSLEEYAVEARAPDARLVEREEAELVREAVLQLPEIYRSVLVLRHYENMKLREIAEVLEVPEGTVNSRIAEGLVRLTRVLEPRLREQNSSMSKPIKSRDRKELLVV
jgi:RNA polymerase sigma-70 factor (ECF subfamily)